MVFTGMHGVCRRQHARKQEKEMYDMANKTRQEDAGAGRSANRAEKPVSLVLLLYLLSLHSVYSSDGGVAAALL